MGRAATDSAVPAWKEAQRRAAELLGEEGLILLNRATTKKLRQSRPGIGR
jgi:hypothetical protein